MDNQNVSTIDNISNIDKLKVSLDAFNKLIETNHVTSIDGCHLSVIVVTYIKSAIEDLQKENTENEKKHTET